MTHTVEAGSLLGRFNRAGVLAPADIHVARGLTRLVGEEDEAVELAVALAVRGPRVGHVYTDLATVRVSAGAVVEDEALLDALPWPAPRHGPLRWPPAPSYRSAPTGRPTGRCGSKARRSISTATGETRSRWRPMSGAGRGSRRRRRRRRRRAAARLFAEVDAGEQRCAAATALRRRLTVIAGGPGTGKTTTVARLLATLMELARLDDRPPPLVALAAPTGKAAARLSEAVRAEAVRSSWTRRRGQRLAQIDASTVHRLLGCAADVGAVPPRPFERAAA